MVPVHQPVSLVPSPSGQHLALVGEAYVSVLELRRHRGPGGEFAGGALETDCLATPVASTLLRAHNLTIQHTSWHPDQLDMLLLLTSDGVLRLFSLTHPEVPHLSVSVLPTAQTPQTLRLEEEGSVVACAMLGECVLLLLERVDVLVVGLHVGAQPSPPLPMHPVTEDSYTAGGCDLLVLSSSPPVVVVATDSGRVLHCVYISREERVSPVLQSASYSLISLLTSSLMKRGCCLSLRRSVSLMPMVLRQTPFACFKARFELYS